MSEVSASGGGDVSKTKKVTPGFDTRRNFGGVTNSTDEHKGALVVSLRGLFAVSEDGSPSESKT